MRNVIYAINTTLDGCCDHTKTIADEDMREYYTQLLGDVELDKLNRYFAKCSVKPVFERLAAVQQWTP
jgi:hypothetical protein